MALKKNRFHILYFSGSCLFLSLSNDAINTDSITISIGIEKKLFPCIVYFPRYYCSSFFTSLSHLPSPQKSSAWKTNCFRVLFILLFVIFTVITPKHHNHFLHYKCQQFWRQTVYMFYLFYRLLLILFFCSDDITTTSIIYSSSVEDKPFQSPVYSTSCSCYCYFIIMKSLLLSLQTLSELKTKH